jgi:hypothetical protein
LRAVDVFDDLVGFGSCAGSAEFGALLVFADFDGRWVTVGLTVLSWHSGLHADSPDFRLVAHRATSCEHDSLGRPDK